MFACWLSLRWCFYVSSHNYSRFLFAGIRISDTGRLPPAPCLSNFAIEFNFVFDALVVLLFPLLLLLSCICLFRTHVFISSALSHLHCCLRLKPQDILEQFFSTTEFTLPEKDEYDPDADAEARAQWVIDAANSCCQTSLDLHSLAVACHSCVDMRVCVLA